MPDGRGQGQRRQTMTFCDHPGERLGWPQLGGGNGVKGTDSRIPEEESQDPQGSYMFTAFPLDM